MSLARERQFWDERARGLDEGALAREARFVAEDPLWRWALSVIEAARPRRVLDAGCGRGATTLALASRAATVVGADASLGSVAAARLLCARAPAAPGFVAAALEALPFRTGSFDAVAGRFVLHHAESLEAAAGEVWRVLRPGGLGVFVETWGRNPVLRFGREVAQLLGIGMGTEDERPLVERDLALLARRFRVERSFPAFTAFELANRLLRRGRGLAARSALARRLLVRAWTAAIQADRLVERRWPAARPWGWYVGLVLSKE